MKRFILQITVILMLVAALPITFFYIKQLSNLSENEEIVQRVFDQQLETILFTINQNSENIFVSWLNQVDLPLDYKSEMMQQVVARLMQNNLAIQQISFYDNDGESVLEVYSREQQIELPNPGWQLSNQLQEYIKQDYQRIESVEHGEFITLFFMMKSLTKPLLGAITIQTNTFIDRHLSPEIQQISQGRFNIGIAKGLSEQNSLKADSSKLENENVHVSPMWYLPGYQISISLQNATIDDLVSSRSKRDNYIFAAMVAAILFAITFVIMAIRREVKLAELKSEFVSNVSHEIRTPLALISMYAETLLLNRVRNEDKKIEYLKVIHQETGRLTALVNRILNFSKMQNNKRLYQMDEVEINQLIREVSENFQAHFHASQVCCELELASNELSISADREAVSESLINLIDNAIKYSKEDERKIIVRTKTDKEFLKIEVEDNGVGIAPSHQKQIFDKFYRVTQGNLAHKAKGSGLGLNIVKQIMEHHQGKITVKSTVGQGSCFTLWFPLKIH